MAHKLIHEFNDMLHGDPVFMIRGPISPFLMMIPWRKKTDHPLPIICINRGRESLMAINEREYFSLATEKFTDYCAKKVSLKDLQNEYHSLAERIQALHEEIMGLSLADRGTNDLQEYMGKLRVVFDELADKTLYIETLDYEKILSVLGSDKKELLDSIWEKATHPTFISFEGRRLKYLLDIANQKNAVEMSRYIYTDYVWTKADSEIELSLGDIRAHFAEKNNEYLKIERETAKRKVEHEVWRGTLSDEARSIVDYMQMVMLFRDIRKDAIGQILASMIVLATEILNRANISIKHAPGILIYEFIKGIEYLRSIEKEIEKRLSGYVAIVNTDDSFKTELCDFDAAVKEFNESIFKKDTDVSSFDGHIANKGKAQGTVRVVIDPHDDRSFRQGDILVTSMTRPEFVHIMKKAGAVVTNEGGITCHAAIVSRELGIPCIIGTKIATNVLKDGDLVEVDADKGIVRILE